jgi:hypothetical protein
MFSDTSGGGLRKGMGEDSRVTMENRSFLGSLKRSEGGPQVDLASLTSRQVKKNMFFAL